MAMSRTQICALLAAMCLLSMTAPDFKNCAAAAGSNKIPAECCAKLAPFAQYAGCLSNPTYQPQATSFLAPVSLSKAQSDCLGAASG
ncbi:MAG: hypothetical protein WDW36_006160 [Sanguina aurantia]